MEPTATTVATKPDETTPDASNRPEVGHCGSLSRPETGHSYPSTRPESEHYTCKRCAKPFKHRTSLSRHMLRCGTDEKNFACFNCNKVFARRDTLTRHQEGYCKGTRPSPATTCLQCNKDFVTSWTLLRHKRTCHAKLKTFLMDLKVASTSQSNTSYEGTSSSSLLNLPLSFLPTSSQSHTRIIIPQSLNGTSLPTSVSHTNNTSNHLNKPIISPLNQLQPAKDNDKCLQELTTDQNISQSLNLLNQQEDKAVQEVASDSSDTPIAEASLINETTPADYVTHSIKQEEVIYSDEESLLGSVVSSNEGAYLESLLDQLEKRNQAKITLENTDRLAEEVATIIREGCTEFSLNEKDLLLTVIKLLSRSC